MQNQNSSKANTKESSVDLIDKSDAEKLLLDIDFPDQSDIIFKLQNPLTQPVNYVKGTRKRLTNQRQQYETNAPLTKDKLIKRKEENRVNLSSDYIKTKELTGEEYQQKKSKYSDYSKALTLDKKPTDTKGTFGNKKEKIVTIERENRIVVGKDPNKSSKNRKVNKRTSEHNKGTNVIKDQLKSQQNCRENCETSKIEDNNVFKRDIGENMIDGSVERNGKTEKHCPLVKSRNEPKSVSEDQYQRLLMKTKCPLPYKVSNSSAPRSNQIIKLEGINASRRYKPYQKKYQCSVLRSPGLELIKSPVVTRHAVMNKKYDEPSLLPFSSIAKNRGDEISTIAPISPGSRTFSFMEWLNKTNVQQNGSSVDDERTLLQTCDEFVNKAFNGNPEPTSATFLGGNEKGYDGHQTRRRNKKKSKQTESRHEEIVAEPYEVSSEGTWPLQNTPESAIINKYIPDVSNAIPKTGWSFGSNLYGYLTEAPALASSVVLRVTERFRGFSVSEKERKQQKGSNYFSTVGSEHSNTSTCSDSQSLFPFEISPPKTLRMQESPHNYDENRYIQIQSTDRMKKILTPRLASASKSKSLRHKHVTRSLSRETNESQSLSDIVAELRLLSLDLDNVLKQEEIAKGPVKASVESNLGSKIKHGISDILSDIDYQKQMLKKDNIGSNKPLNDIKSPAHWLNYASDKMTQSKDFAKNKIHDSKEYAKETLIASKDHVMDKFGLNNIVTKLKPLKYEPSRDKKELVNVNNMIETDDIIPVRTKSYMEQLGLEDYITCDEDGNPKKELFGVRRHCKKLYKTLRGTKPLDQKDSNQRIVSSSRTTYRKGYDYSITDEDDSFDDSDANLDSFQSELSSIIGSNPTPSSTKRSDGISYLDLCDRIGNDLEELSGNATDKEQSDYQIDSSVESCLTSASSGDSKSRSLEDICADFRFAAEAIHDCLPPSETETGSNQDTHLNKMHRNKKCLNEESLRLFVDI